MPTKNPWNEAGKRLDAAVEALAAAIQDECKLDWGDNFPTSEREIETTVKEYYWSSLPSIMEKMDQAIRRLTGRKEPSSESRS